MRTDGLTALMVAGALALAACSKDGETKTTPTAEAPVPSAETGAGDGTGSGETPEVTGGSAESKGEATGVETVASVEALVKKAPEKGAFKVEGFVLHKDECPQCPKGVNCEPCLGQMVLSDRGKGDPDSGKDVRVVAGARAKDFEAGKRYTFTLMPRGKSASGGFLVFALGK